MGLPRFGVHQNSYEALKKFHDGWAYFGRGWIVGLLRSTIGALTDLLSAMTLYLGRSRASVEYFEPCRRTLSMRRLRWATTLQFA